MNTEFVGRCFFCFRWLTEAQLVEVYDDGVYASCRCCADNFTS